MTVIVVVVAVTDRCWPFVLFSISGNSAEIGRLAGSPVPPPSLINNFLHSGVVRRKIAIQQQQQQRLPPRAGNPVSQIQSAVASYAANSLDGPSLPFTDFFSLFPFGLTAVNSSFAGPLPYSTGFSEQKSEEQKSVSDLGSPSYFGATAPVLTTKTAGSDFQMHGMACLRFIALSIATSKTRTRVEKTKKRRKKAKKATAIHPIEKTSGQRRHRRVSEVEAVLVRKILFMATSSTSAAFRFFCYMKLNRSR